MLERREKGSQKVGDGSERNEGKNQEFKAVFSLPDRSAFRPDRSVHLKQAFFEFMGDRIDPVLAISIPTPEVKHGSICERTGSIRFWQ